MGMFVSLDIFLSKSVFRAHGMLNVLLFGCATQYTKLPASSQTSPARAQRTCRAAVHMAPIPSISQTMATDSLSA